MKNKIYAICLWVGVGLLAIAIAGLAFWQINIHSAAKKAEGYVTALRTRMPTPQGAVPEARRDNAMPVLSVDGVDFVGILELPRFGSALPVAGGWGKISQYPCRFTGSVYDRTLQIGATTQAGQYDFYREISAGDTVCFTDMEGNRYTYQVTDIRYEQHADNAALSKKEADLTVFIKNIYAMEYIILFCNVPQ